MAVRLPLVLTNGLLRQAQATDTIDLTTGVNLPLSTGVTGTFNASAHPALTGDVTTVAGALATTIAANAVTNAKMAVGAAVSNIGFTPAGIAANSFTGVQTFTKAISQSKGASVASAATADIWTPADGNYIHITGTTTITSLGTSPQAGAERTVVFDGALTLTHNATSLILPGGANITTAIGDIMIVRADTTANMKVVNYTYANANVSFTPALKFGGTNVSMTTSTTYGLYTVVGRVVTFSIRITLTAKGSSVGGVTITGLPFNCVLLNSVPVSFYANMVSITNGNIQGLISTNSITLYYGSTSTTSAGLTDANFSNTSDIILGGSYTI